MDHADFVHHVRVNEYLSAEDPSGYRRRVALFAGVGYAWIALCLTAAVLLSAWALRHLLAGQVKPVWLFLLVGSVGLGWTSLRSLFVRLDAMPDGHRITADQAPALFKLLAQIRRKVKGPTLHEVWLDDRFNASISQVPRFGLLGTPVNRLRIGLPLLMALDVPRLSAVLAHEYGHLRGNHGQFAAWIYRTRLSWMRMNERLADDSSVAAWLNQRFMNWYVPRFLARSFAMARQDEYEADRIAARLVGAETAGAALVEIDVKARWMAERFWRQHWQGATTHAQPLGPMKALRHLLAAPPESEFASEALRMGLRQISQLDDTHPVLKERLASLSAPAALPAWSVKGSLALLGTQGDAWIARFDQAWCRNQASGWKTQHQRQQGLKARVQAWRERSNSLGTDELALWADCERRLDSEADVAEIYERVLARNPAHVGALQGLLRTADARTPLPQRLAWADRLWQANEDQRAWAARCAVAWLERPAPGTAMDDAALKHWRQRAKQAQTADVEVWDALCTPPWLTHLSRHDLNELEVEDLRHALQWHGVIDRAWLVCRRLPAHSQRRAYLLFLACPDLPDGQHGALCRQLIQQIGLNGPVLPLCLDDELRAAEVERATFGTVYPAPAV